MIGVDRNQIGAARESETPCLAMRLPEAAKALRISERLLWEWTDRGVVPHVRLGKAVLYPVDSLREWLRQNARTGEQREGDSPRNSE